MTGFYKQAEEMGYSPEATYAMLQQLNKVAEAAHTYVEEAANASGDPVLFKKALVQELLEKNAEGDLNSAVQGFLANHPQIQGFLANHPNIQKMLTTMQQGGAGGGVLGGLGGGALGLIMSLMTGSNPLTGMLAGGGLGAGAGYFGKDMYNAFQNHTNPAAAAGATPPVVPPAAGADATKPPAVTNPAEVVGSGAASAAPKLPDAGSPTGKMLSGVPDLTQPSGTGMSSALEAPFQAQSAQTPQAKPTGLPAGVTVGPDVQKAPLPNGASVGLPANMLPTPPKTPLLGGTADSTPTPKPVPVSALPQAKMPPAGGAPSLGLPGAQQLKIQPPVGIHPNMIPGMGSHI